MERNSAIGKIKGMYTDIESKIRKKKNESERLINQRRRKGMCTDIEKARLQKRKKNKLDVRINQR